MSAVHWLIAHDTVYLAGCGVLIAIAVAVHRTSRKVERDLDIILGPDRLAHVQQNRAWRRISR